VTALVLTHAANEGPGWLADWLPAAGLGLDVLEPWNGDDLPERVEGHEALVVMGGPQQAYDDRSAPWLRQTKDLLRRAVGDGVPVLAVCLGAQLLAEAMGGRTAVGEVGPELGARLVAKRDAASPDPLFYDLPFTPPVVQWHRDAIQDLPPGAVLLASSARYANQAFRIGPSAWGLQFHIETPPRMVQDWVRGDVDALVEAGLDPDAVLAAMVAELDEVAEVWQPVVGHFARLALERGVPG
jgi:GMP synthase (glutamine-hydrolysing)